MSIAARKVRQCDSETETKRDRKRKTRQDRQPGQGSYKMGREEEQRRTKERTYERGEEIETNETTV